MCERIGGAEGSGRFGERDGYPECVERPEGVEGAEWEVGRESVCFVVENERW